MANTDSKSGKTVQEYGWEDMHEIRLPRAP